jgi:hypothetical protein
MRNAPQFSLYLGTRRWAAEIHLPRRQQARWWFRSVFSDGVRYCLFGMASVVVNGETA